MTHISPRMENSEPPAVPKPSVRARRGVNEANKEIDDGGFDRRNFSRSRLENRADKADARKRLVKIPTNFHDATESHRVQSRA